jgi:hypothetical protein
MFLVETMTMAPNCCLTCGKGNTPDGRTGVVGPFVDLAIDYNWGDSGYMCSDCVAKLAVLFGWISPDTKKEQDLKIAKLEKEIHDLNADMDRRRLREKKVLRKARIA